MPRKKLSLIFPPELVGEPITYRLIKEYGLLVNILKAKITPQEEGRLDIEVEGDKETVERATRYLTELGVKVQPLAQEIKWYPERCVSCGVCVPLCPPGALETEEGGEISFTQEKCIACGLCVPACPYRAVEILF